MKKLFALLLAVLMLCALCACGEEAPTTSTPEESTVACAHEHCDFKETKTPTCTEKGLTQKVCTDCGAVLEETESPAVGHVWSPQRDESGMPLKDADGNVMMACGICGQAFGDAAVVPGA